ncbi:hypothetical protein CP532_2103 [Ophiocordyceps camponoti-leonardi (nom. inval.)]|nr:hypothetical protein CP532_2103 [Ophiocordyceps camponoti-leonardi (nom. inval.)]
MLPADDAEEVLDEDGNEDAAMDSDDDNEEVILQSDAIAYFDHAPPDSSLFAIAQHPRIDRLIAVGGSAGSSDEAPGAGWIFRIPQGPVLPESYASGGKDGKGMKTQMESLFHLDGHEDSISALCWTLPRGEVLLSAGLDGRLRAWKTSVEDGGDVKASFLAERREVEEINWLIPLPTTSSSPQRPTTIALGASDGSVWVYEVNADATDELQDSLRIIQFYYLHTASSTAGAWSPDGSLLATVSEDGSLFVWDVWADPSAPTTVVSMTDADQRFAVDGGLFSVTFDPNGGFVAVGGAQGIIKIVSLPRLTTISSSSSSTSSGGQVLATLQAQTDSIESLSTSRPSPTITLLASGSVDGTIAIFDATRRFAVRRLIPSAHDGLSVVSVDFLPAGDDEKDNDGKNQPWLLDSCGLDGVLRRWDLRASPSSAEHDAAPLREWRGHRGGDDGAGGILGFVRTPGGRRIVTAGDDGIALVFEA